MIDLRSDTVTKPSQGMRWPRVDLSRVQTNIVMLDLESIDAADAVARLRDRGVLCLAPGPRRLRLVTHLDVDRAACERAADIIAATVVS